jgi:amino acid adenylation domain-containing protein
MQLIHQYLEESARRTPNKVALVCGERRLSFSELDMEANRLAHALIAQGVERGDPVCVYMENAVEAAVAIFGILKAGAVFSVINASTKGPKLGYILRDIRPAALLTVNDAPRRSAVGEALQAAPLPSVVWVGGVPTLGTSNATRFHDWHDALAREPGTAPRATAIDVDLAAILYTSGSTGEPKGVMSTHRSMAFLAQSISTYLENSADDVVFCALPLAFGYGLYQLIVCTYVGATLVLERNFAFPARALEIMARERATGFPGVPTMFALLLRLHNLAGFDLRSLRYITNAGAALPVKHLLALHEAVPQTRIYSMYGQTECQRICYLPPEEITRRPDSVGIPIPGTEVYIVDEGGRRVPPGIAGELVVRGSHVMRGYRGKPEETLVRFRPGPLPGEMVLHTGDLFRMDEDGFLYFVARKDDIIKSRGEKISPHEIVNALCALSGVSEAAVIGVPDEVLGEAIKVFVVPDEGAVLTEQAIRAHCACHLEDFMVPKYVEIRPELPKGATGKINLRELKACVASPAR